MNDGGRRGKCAEHENGHTLCGLVWIAALGLAPEQAQGFIVSRIEEAQKVAVEGIIRAR